MRPTTGGVLAVKQTRLGVPGTKRCMQYVCVCVLARAHACVRCLFDWWDANTFFLIEPSPLPRRVSACLNRLRDAPSYQTSE